MNFRNMEKAYRKRQTNINPETMWNKKYYGNPKLENASLFVYLFNYV